MKPRDAASPASMTAPRRAAARPSVRVVLGHAARNDLREALENLEEWSSTAGRKLLRALDRKVVQLQRFPESAPVDESAESLPFGDEARARSTQVLGYAIRYVYPVQVDGDAALLLVSIRHGRRIPIDNTDFIHRFLEELMRAHAKERARSERDAALPEGAPREGAALSRRATW